MARSNRSKIGDLIRTPIPEPVVVNGQADTDTQESVVQQHAASKASRDRPNILHRFHHNRSILALVTTKDYIWAGTQAGEILVFSLTTYEKVDVIEAHHGSVLGLCLSKDGSMLFSGAADRFVNVWSTHTLTHLASIYSHYDVGDIFCVSYSSKTETVYLGAQNTSIQWFNLQNYTSRPPPPASNHPLKRTDKFFDSPGPGGIRTPRRQSVDHRVEEKHCGHTLEIDKQHIHQFAHYGFVYCTLIAQGADIGFHEEDEVLLSGGGDGAINLWRLHSKGGISRIASLVDGSSGGESVLSIVLDASFLYSGRVDGEVNVWDLETRQLLRTLHPRNSDIASLSFGDGMLYTADVDGEVYTFDQRHTQKSTFKAHQGLVLASSFAKREEISIYVTGGNDSTVALWDVTDQSDTRPVTSKAVHGEILESLRQMISFRTISIEPRYKADCRKAASYLRGLLKKQGAATQLIKTQGGCNPIVYGLFQGIGGSSKMRKRLLFYGHYDVVPAENKQNQWRTDPFTMHGMDGYLYGRGASDNKGPIIAAIYAAAEAVQERKLDIDIVFLIEGEEESGSKGFREAIRQEKDLVGHIDWILLANSYWLDDQVPCLTYGLRGVIHANIEIQSEHPDLHSGVDGSSLLSEPLKDLVTLISRISRNDGKVAIPGFYEPILPISEEEKQLFDRNASIMLERNPSLGDAETLVDSLLERWTNATFTIHGFKTSGSEKSTIIPSAAKAVVSFRLVPNQEVDVIEAAFRRFIHAEFAEMASNNSLSVKIDHRAEPWLGDRSNHIFRTLEQAVIDVWLPGQEINRKSSHSSSGPSQEPSHKRKGSLGPATSSTLANRGSEAPLEADTDETVNGEDEASWTTPLYIREGGSIPAIRFLEKEFDAPAAHLPCGQASDNAHLDNERFRVKNLWNSKEVFKSVFLRLPKK